MVPNDLRGGNATATGSPLRGSLCLSASAPLCASGAIGQGFAPHPKNERLPAHRAVAWQLLATPCQTRF